LLGEEEGGGDRDQVPAGEWRQSMAPQKHFNLGRRIALLVVLEGMLNR
jgi:hypothetical protein